MNNGNPFFDRPVLNSPYACPERHWELDDQGQPTQKIVGHRRPAEFITPIPKPKKRKGAGQQARLVFDEGLGLSTAKQQYQRWPRHLFRAERQCVQGALGGTHVALGQVDVEHRLAQVGMAEQQLDGAQISASLEQMSRETMA